MSTNQNQPANPPASKNNVKKKGPAEVERNYEIRPKLIMKFAFIKVDALSNINHVRNTRTMRKQLIKILANLS